PVDETPTADLAPGLEAAEDRQEHPPRRGVALPDEEVAEDDAVAAEQLAGHELVAFGRLDASLSCGATRILADAIRAVPPPARSSATALAAAGSPASRLSSVAGTRNRGRSSRRTKARGLLRTGPGCRDRALGGRSSSSSSSAAAAPPVLSRPQVTTPERHRCS